MVCSIVILEHLTEPTSIQGAGSGSPGTTAPQAVYRSCRLGPRAPVVLYEYELYAARGAIHTRETSP
jgi:hypothetical protein